MELFLDFETTGFLGKGLPLDHPSQPHIVQIGAILRDDGLICAEVDALVECPIEVPEGARKIHGIDRNKTMRCGITITDALELMGVFIGKADLLVAHNASFDVDVLKCAFLKENLDIPNSVEFIRTFCTMKEMAAALDVRWPKLEDAYRIATMGNGKLESSRSHHAITDARRCIEIYDYLQTQHKENRK